MHGVGKTDSITALIGNGGPNIVLAAYGWPANQQADAVYPYTEVDSARQKLTGANKFAKDATPPVNAFWRSRCIRSTRAGGLSPMRFHS
jgi:hypothetical protein